MQQESGRVVFTAFHLIARDGVNEPDKMPAVTISKHFQVVIPKQIRLRFRLRAGQRVTVLDYNGQIRLIPLQPITHLRGSLKGIDTTVPRERDECCAKRGV